MARPKRRRVGSLRTRLDGERRRHAETALRLAAREAEVETLQALLQAQGRVTPVNTALDVRRLAFTTCITDAAAGNDLTAAVRRAGDALVTSLARQLIASGAVRTESARDASGTGTLLTTGAYVLAPAPGHTWDDAPALPLRMELPWGER